MSFKLTRRQAIAATAATPLLAATASPGFAGGHGGKAPMPLAHTFNLGSFGVTTLLDGTTPRDEPQSIFGMNVSPEEFATVSEANFISTDSAQFYFTPTVIDTGTDVVLFDTGLGQGGLQKALAEAGVEADAVNVVVITHMHPDHIGGLMTDGQPTFPNARYVTASAEYDFWSAQEAGNRVGDMVKQNVTPLAEKMTFIEDGGEVVSGVTAMAAFGHTPGHMTYMLESDGQQLVLMADLANHYVWSLAYPDWEVRFDMDKAAAAASRRRVLGMLAADKIPMIGYHMPFPAAGFVDTRDDGFRYVPVSYQLM
ncbi:MBL fold metallo-hydrolase [Parasulfitobacter algicola]|uniref:MBL fold metallo-hydrolase n=1 Tax=Parasulfitobacter algicola TaxID=2614809 RepID=A0ABX2IMH7_9RHOB|nr:MBL fold metallo-hydrolase [Sulfitobacter algicola]NSX54092.1 MBL fold metallo-hydrolase [Sulfitobacter algicola]